MSVNLWYACWCAKRRCTPANCKRVANQLPLLIRRSTRKLFKHKAALCYRTLQTSRKSTDAAHRSIYNTWADVQSGFELLYCPYGLKIIRRYVSVNLLQEDFLAIIPTQSANVLRHSLQLADAPCQNHVCVLPRSHSNTRNARAQGHTYISPTETYKITRSGD